MLKGGGGGGGGSPPDPRCAALTFFPSFEEEEEPLPKILPNHPPPPPVFDADGSAPPDCTWFVCGASISPVTILAAAYLAASADEASVIRKSDGASPSGGLAIRDPLLLGGGFSLRGRTLLPLLLLSSMGALPVVDNMLPMRCDRADAPLFREEESTA